MWQKVKGWLIRSEYNRIVLLYLTVTIIFTCCFGYYLRQGWKHLHELTSPGDMITTALAIISGALAIFFTLATVVVQNLTQKYSSSFLKTVVGNFIFKLSFIMMLGFIIGNLFLLHCGSNSYFETLSFITSIYIIIAIGLMIRLIIYFFDIRNIVPFVTKKAYKHIKRIPSILPTQNVPDKITIDLENELRPIMSACMKALVEDNREIVLACLEEISNISCSYLTKRKNYSEMNDKFLIFLYSQIEILFNTAVNVPNQQYTADIVETVRKISEKCIELTSTQLMQGVNGLVNIWIGFFKKVVMESSHLEHTSAPLDAISNISNIGIGLIEEEAMTTATFSVAESLKEIGMCTGRVRRIWMSSLCQCSVSGLMKMILALFKKLSTKGLIESYIISKHCEDLGEIMRASYESELDYFSYQTISAPLVGSLWQGKNLAGIFRDVLSHQYQNPHGEFNAIKELEHLVSSLRWIGASAVAKNKCPAHEYFMAFSLIAFLTIKYIKGLESRATSDEINQYKEEAHSLLEKIIEGVANLFSLHATSEGDGPDYLYHLSPIFAFLTYYSRDSESKLFYNECNMFIERFIKIYTNFNTQGLNQERKKEELYRYLKLFGAWIHKYSQKDALNMKLTKLLAKDNPEDIKGRHIYLLSEMQRLHYPVGTISERWYIFPSDYWADVQMVVTNELNDLNNYRSYHERIQSCCKKL